MSKELIKEAIKEMIRDGELSINVRVTDGSEYYCTQPSDEQTVRVIIEVTDEQGNELTSDSDSLSFRKS